MTSNQNNTNQTTTDFDTLLVSNIVSMVNREHNKWIGTMTQLGTTLTSLMGRKNAKQMPGSPSALRVALNRVLPRIRARGVSVKFARMNDDIRTRYVQF